MLLLYIIFIQLNLIHTSIIGNIICDNDSFEIENGKINYLCNNDIQNYTVICNKHYTKVLNRCLLKKKWFNDNIIISGVDKLYCENNTNILKIELIVQNKKKKYKINNKLITKNIITNKNYYIKKDNNKLYVFIFIKLCIKLIKKNIFYIE